ncbi:MAG: hypothetical protein J6Q17_08900 [Clostridia bacterium]|nr:hypothetical protein [Clostridia bacterium]
MAERSVFPTLIGNERLRALFRDGASRGRIAHAYVLEGPRGSGKHTAARLMAAAMLCENRDSAGEPLPCGRCASCRKVLGGHSVDVLTVSRGTRATLGVEPIRKMRESLWVTPNDGDMKFYLIEDAHLMTAQAQNALLLSLEEPPPYVMILLLCEDAAQLLETVRSRAPVLPMERFSPAFAEEWLAAQTKNPDRARIVKAAHLSGGSLGAAKTLYSGDASELARYETAEELTRLLLSGRRSEALAFGASLPKDRGTLRQILSLARVAMRDVIAEKKNGELLFFGAKEGIPAYAKKVSVRRAAELIALLARSEDDLAANLSPSTVMTALFAGSSAQ